MPKETKKPSSRRGRPKMTEAEKAEARQRRADDRAFNDYLAQVTEGAYAPPGKPGRKATGKKQGKSQEEKLAELEAKKGEMTALAYWQKQQKLLGKTTGQEEEDLKGKFLEALPRVMKRMELSTKDLRDLGVPYSDLVEAGLVKKKGRKGGNER